MNRLTLIFAKFLGTVSSTNMLNTLTAPPLGYRSLSQQLVHGGGLRAVAAHYQIPWSDWLDLSTGINPLGWPIPRLPPSVWQRLPENDDGLLAAAADYYGTGALLPVAGTQAALQVLPQLRHAGNVVIAAPTYAEHARAWQGVGHEVRLLPWSVLTGPPTESTRLVLDQADVFIVVHPNNPTGDVVDTDRLLAIHARLSRRGGWLIVDEAFMDATPGQSLVVRAPPAGLIILRSLGKFFGLAGLRVGFVMAEPGLLQTLDHRLGPWAVNGPGRYLATRALRDARWIDTMRLHLPLASARLAALLKRHGLSPSGGNPLFQWVKTTSAPALQQALAQQAIWVRRFDDPQSLRFGLPGTEADWLRLDNALAQICSETNSKA